MARGRKKTKVVGGHKSGHLRKKGHHKRGGKKR